MTILILNKLLKFQISPPTICKVWDIADIKALQLDLADWSTLSTSLNESPKGEADIRVRVGPTVRS